MRTLGEMIERNERFFPDRDAFACGSRRVTNGQLAARARKLSSALNKRGLRRQDRVAVLAMNCLEYYETYRACDWGGFILAAVNFRLAPPEILYILGDAAPKALVFEAQYAGIVEQLRPQLRGIEVFACIGAEPTGSVAFEALIDEGSEAGPPDRSRPEDYCYLHYTSGTTGRPKGVYRTHATGCATNTITALSSEFNGATRLLQTSPAFHVGGSGYVNAVSSMGGFVLVHKVFDPVAMLESVSRERITFTFMVGAMLQAVLDVPNFSAYDTSSLKGIVTAAAPIPVPLLKRGIEAFGRIFSIQFGMTESSGTFMPIHDVNPYGTPDQVRRLGSVGHPCPGIELRVVGDDGAECTTGMPGEVWLRSQTQLAGYWNNSVATSEAIVEGWYRTGDVGYRDEEGYLFLVDRKKDMIISGGENIYSREVEIALAEHPAVVDCAVVGRPDPKWGESVHAVVVLRKGASAGADELIAHCKQLIASYKCPKSVAFIDELPRLATGKINKLQLRTQLRAPQS
jgi:acyl-CoA synthetase (AMP-forming)/AMP-acid ligase II